MTTFRITVVACSPLLDEIDRLNKLVEAAYREGWRKRSLFREDAEENGLTPDEYWLSSDVKKELER